MLAETDNFGSLIPTLNLTLNLKEPNYTFFYLKPAEQVILAHYHNLLLVQRKPLNVITDKVIIWLMRSNLS
jgi:hypothetical protein